MKLIDMGDQYDGGKMRQLIRLLELELTRLSRRVSTEETSSSGGSSVALSDSNPSPLGVAAPGTGAQASRYDHVHEMPDAGDVGAESAGAVAAHVAASDPHPQYLQSADIVPYSLSLIEEGDTVTIPAGHNLLLIDEGLDLQGDLILQGSLFSVAPNV